TTSGIQAFYRSMALQNSQTLIMEGDMEKMRHILLPNQTNHTESSSAIIDEMVAKPSPDFKIDSNTLLDQTVVYLRKLFAGTLKLSVQELDPKAPLENYGIDS
ncbi:acyl carrier protein, partial [Aquimarina celericrescens]|nr:acyl carrier protein [Aquimarina celericrescens]